MAHTCLCHTACRRALRDRLAAWSTATYPRMLITVTFGALGWCLATAICLFAYILVLWSLVTQTGAW